MITLHRLNGAEFVLNSRHIETVEHTPDTVILLTNDRRYVVKESVDDVLQAIVKYERQVRHLPQ